MATSFSSLPLVDLSVLSATPPTADERNAKLLHLSDRLDEVFRTTGFAYLTNLPYSFTHAEVFGLTREFFALSESDKLRLAKKNFVKGNSNTYRGYFPPQPGQADNLKEGFEIGPVQELGSSGADVAARYQGAGRRQQGVNLAERTRWPGKEQFSAESRARLEQLYTELQSLSATILSLLAIALGQHKDFFNHYLDDSLSTLRLLHYPPQPQRAGQQSDNLEEEVKLCCTPHTDSGILTLLHQDSTGGLEVRNSEGDWVPAPYVAESLVVNIGDLMAEVSGGRYIATTHRVRVLPLKSDGLDGMGRLSVPFFFEPSEHCVLRRVDDQESQGIVYGDHVRAKMDTWVEFQDSEVIALDALDSFSRMEVDMPA